MQVNRCDNTHFGTIEFLNGARSAIKYKVRNPDDREIIRDIVAAHEKIKRSINIYGNGKTNPRFYAVIEDDPSHKKYRQGFFTDTISYIEDLVKRADKIWARVDSKNT